MNQCVPADLRIDQLSTVNYRLSTGGSFRIGVNMYTRFFGFKERPFKLVPNPAYLYLSKGHEEALAHLQFAFFH